MKPWQRGPIRLMVAVFGATMALAVIMWRPTFRQMNEMELAYIATMGGIIAAVMAIEAITSFFEGRKK